MHFRGESISLRGHPLRSDKPKTFAAVRNKSVATKPTASRTINPPNAETLCRDRQRT